MLQYKISYTDSDWLPKDGGIKLWKEDKFRKPLLPYGESKPLSPHIMKNLAEIVMDLGSFIKLWDTMGLEDPTARYCQKHKNLSHYWKGVKDALYEVVEPQISLRNGFWPTSRVSASMMDQNNDVFQEEFAEDALYVGQRHHCPTESFCMAQDVYVGYFIALRPKDDDSKLFWLARVLTDVNSDWNHPNEIKIEF